MDTVTRQPAASAAGTAVSCQRYTGAAAAAAERDGAELRPLSACQREY